MKKIMYAVLIMSLSIGYVNAANKWTGGKKVTSVQVVGNGGFIVYFDSKVSSVCTAAGTNSVYIYPDSSVTESGAKAMLSTALVAFSSGSNLNVMYDDATEYCWGRYVLISK